MSKQNAEKDGPKKSGSASFPTGTRHKARPSAFHGWKKSQEQEKRERKKRPFQTRAEEQAEWVVWTAASVSTSAEDLPAPREMVFKCPRLTWPRSEG